MKKSKSYILVSVVTLFCLLMFFSYAHAESIQAAEAKMKVKSLLRDPNSAEFQNIRTVVNSKAEESVCGEVNARNAFGGYTGFRKFNASRGEVNIVDIENPGTVRFYKLSGGAGPEAELEVRLEEEALFNCNVIWNLLTNVIVEKQSETAALDAAMVAINNRAKDNGGEISDEQARMIRFQFQQSLTQTLANKKLVKAIRKDPEYQKKVTIPLMYASTLSALKEQTKISERI
ncbi:MAG: hypothetical protein ABH844_01485 [Candidatus Omnitrophota bacterium]